MLIRLADSDPFTEVSKPNTVLEALKVGRAGWADPLNVANTSKLRGARLVP